MSQRYFIFTKNIPLLNLKKKKNLTEEELNSN